MNDLIKTNSPVIEIPIEIVNQILAHAQSVAESEICGFIATKNGSINKIYPVENIASSPECFYRMDEVQQIDAMRKIREAGEEMFGIYHSHPSSEAVPSATDIKEAAYPDAVYFIVSLNTVGVLEMRGFRLNKEAVKELELSVVS
ncbi:MAG: M67 family metallopeptidase [Gammaproteobacteria bacterium]|nr:M67 family metallopeptidase [Gammaproteobacteria bacterium]